jgi:hypothetical protein
VVYQPVPLSQQCLVNESSFDFACFVCLIFVLAAFKVDLNQCEELYKHFSTTVFHRNKALGISSLITSQSYYDTKSFEDYLR